MPPFLPRFFPAGPAAPAPGGLLPLPLAPAVPGAAAAARPGPVPALPFEAAVACFFAPAAAFLAFAAARARKAACFLAAWAAFLAAFCSAALALAASDTLTLASLATRCCSARIASTSVCFAATRASLPTASTASTFRLRVLFQWFLIELSVRPGRLSAIFAHLLPYCWCARTRAASSSSLQLSRLMSGLR